jgi:VIT1/CCC1 family predicted Fe2+/Mn2+ transporter
VTVDPEKRRGVIEKMYLEHRAQARHLETLRTGVLGSLGVAVGILVTIATDAQDSAIAPGVTIIVLGGFGVVFALKLHEKLRLEMRRSEACLAALFQDDPGEAVSLYDRVSKAHDQAHPVMHRVKLAFLWAGLASVICVAGALLVVFPKPHPKSGAAAVDYPTK